jgi:hypothetical protein
MWDALITIGNLIVIPGLFSTVVNRQAFVPRMTSGTSVVGLTLVIAGLLGAGLVLSPIVLLVMNLMWVYIFLYRHRPVGSPIIEVTD